MTEDPARHQIARELLAAGLRPGGTVLVHSSLSSMGWVQGGPRAVVDGLLDALGPNGTLLMPALSYRTCNATRPVFDVRHTPTNVGRIPEWFRTRPGTQRSVCPTHSVCGVGRDAAPLLGEHQLDDTPCGPHSPFRRLRDRAGQILFLGCGLKPNTSMHAIEEVAGAPYLLREPVTYRAILADASECTLTCHAHDFAGWTQRYDRLGPLLGPGGLRVGRVLEATVHVVECEAMWEQALAALRRDPHFFVQPHL